MRRKILTALTAAVLSTSVFSDAPESSSKPNDGQRAMSRSDVIRYAFKNSESLAQLEAEHERIVYMRKEYYGKALPDINGAINYVLAPNLNGEKEDRPSVSEVVDGMEPSNADRVLAGALDGISGALGAMSVKNTLQWEVKATQPIFAQGKVKTGLKIAEISLETLEEKYRGEQLELSQNIINAYNSALLAQQNAVIQQDALIIAEESYRIAKARFETGKGSALDTLNARYEQQQAISRLRDAQKNEKLTMETLMTAASLDDKKIILSDSLIVPQFDMTEDAAWEKMRQNNSSLKLLSQAKMLQTEQTHLTKTDYLPMIGAFASIGQHNLFDNGDEFADSGSWQWDFKVGVGVQIPIFNGGQRKNKLRQAKFEELKLDKQEIEAERGLRLALSAAFEDLAVAKEELARTAQMIALTEQGLRISKLSFELGQITQLELNNSEQNNRGAKTAYNSAIFGINSAVMNIEKLIGSEDLISIGN
ncbi:MAG: TolC family protein [Chitinispirillales bacterium]|jgi:outer membrane protein TolC|nr:TolC family protein [Chitinispirillales bacterium]